MSVNRELVGRRVSPLSSLLFLCAISLIPLSHWASVSCFQQKLPFSAVELPLSSLGAVVVIISKQRFSLQLYPNVAFGLSQVSIVRERRLSYKSKFSQRSLVFRVPLPSAHYHYHCYNAHHCDHCSAWCPLMDSSYLPVSFLVLTFCASPF